MGNEKILIHIFERFQSTFHRKAGELYTLRNRPKDIILHLKKTMTRIILESGNRKDVLLIKELAERLKIKYKIQDLSETGTKKNNDIKQHYQLIDKGVDVSNYGDPSLWQKKVRKDRLSLS